MLLAWLRSRVPSMFALYGAIGGGIGFGVGASLQPMGRAVWAGMPLGWWKAMELTFGALLGLAYVAVRVEPPKSAGRRIPINGRRCRPHRSLARSSQRPRDRARDRGRANSCPSASITRSRGAVLASLLLLSESLAWQTAITATYAAFAWDFLDYQTFAPLPLAWTFVVVMTVVVTIVVARHPRTLAMLLLLTWAAEASAFRFFLPPSSVGRESATLLAVFVGLALVMSLMLLRRQNVIRWIRSRAVVRYLAADRLTCRVLPLRRM